jgi:hypothetical protein
LTKKSIKHMESAAGEFLLQFAVQKIADDDEQ